MIPVRVQQILEQSGAIAGAAKLIVAVSGGCDSVALLHILNHLRGSLAVELHVASLDHGLRGAAGQGDLDFVRQLAGQWDLPHTLGQADVPLLSQSWGTGVEEAARRARYDFLAQVAKQEDCQNVVLGHHADDQAETILLNIVRGSGLRGLGGMRLVSPLPNHPQLKLIRPLLTAPRAELEAYCRAQGLNYRRDETNWDTTFARNYLRHEVMPRLARLNPNLGSALQRLAEAAVTDLDFVGSHLESLERAAVRRWHDGCSISRALFLEAHPALQRGLLRRAFNQIAAGESLSHERTLDLLDYCQSARTGSGRDIGAGLELRIGYDEFRIQRKCGQDPPSGYRLIPTGTNIVLGPADALELGGVSIAVRAQPCDCESRATLVLPTDCELRLRTRRAGDRFRPKGMGGRSRKLKDWMIDRKIPRHIRDQIALLCADDAIVAICLGVDWRLADLDALYGSARSGILVCLD